MNLEGHPMQLEGAIVATDDLMYQAVESDVKILEDASRHIVTAGGKRVRPRMLFLCYLALGGTNLEQAVPIATAVELVHTATLVHDDINDHGRLRRGRVTVNEQWGRTFALLTGDYLFTKVYSLMAPYGDLNKILAEATVALVEGETLQAAAAKENNLNREVYQKIVAKKTASLFRAAALLGSNLANGSQRDVDALGDFGFYLGLTFQIVDDLLDLTGDSRLIGKDAGVDVEQGKGVATAYSHDHSNSNGNDHVQTIASIAESPETEEGDPFLKIKRRLIEGGAVEEGKQMAQFLASQARTSLQSIAPNEYVAQLENLVDQILSRTN